MNLTERACEHVSSFAKFRDWLVILLLFSLPAGAAPGPDDGNDHLRQRLEQLTAAEGAGIRYAAPSVLQAFYQTHDYNAVWSDATARAFVAMAEDAQSHGLDPVDYLVTQLKALPPLSTLSGPARADADLLLTEAFLRFAYHCRFGKVDPKSIETTWNYSRSVSADGPFAALDRIMRAEDFSGQFMQEMGHGAVYDAMRALLARYRGFADSEDRWPTVAQGAPIKPNARDPRVPVLRARLIAEGYEAGVADTADLFDPVLLGAVQAFQRSHGLGDDGVVGKRTVEELNVSAQDRVDQIRINLERLRWVLVDRTPRFIGVNIAGYRMYYVEDNKPTWTTRAVVGKPYRKTPVFRAELNYLVLNPYWTVPPTILRKDVLPKMAKDPAYLAEHNMDVVDASGHAVDPKTVDWPRYPAATFPYLIRQRPGPTNSLGRVKFIFPNPHFVFLHDTPAKDLFEKPDRTFSSGCIRIENPLDLAEILLQNKPEWSRAAIDAAIADGTTKTVDLDQPIPVLVLYLTAIAFDDGRDFAFYRDVYGRDAALWKALNTDFVYVPPQGMPDLGA